MRILFKILTAADWADAVAAGTYRGSAADHRDGFIHLSAGHQVRETAAKHFAGEEGLMLAAFAEADLAQLKWEASRGGDLFPHVYGAIPAKAAFWVKPLPLVNGVHLFPAEAGL